MKDASVGSLDLLNEFLEIVWSRCSCITIGGMKKSYGYGTCAINASIASWSRLIFLSCTLLTESILTLGAGCSNGAKFSFSFLTLRLNFYFRKQFSFFKAAFSTVIALSLFSNVLKLKTIFCSRSFIDVCSISIILRLSAYFALSSDRIVSSWPMSSSFCSSSASFLALRAVIASFFLSRTRTNGFSSI